MVAKILGFGKKKEVMEEDPYISTQHEAIPEVRPDEVRMLHLFAERFGTPKKAAYIGSGTDASVIEAFPRAHVDLVDPDAQAMTAFDEYAKDSRIRCIVGDARAYAPEVQNDLLVDVCSAATAHALGTLRAGGYLVHHATYSPWTVRNKELKLVGVVINRGDGEHLITKPEAVQRYAELVDDFDARWKHEFDPTPDPETGRVTRDPSKGFMWSSGRKKRAEWYIFQKVPATRS
jgi:hypothetical protein